MYFQNWSRTLRLAREFLWVVAGQVLVVIGSLALVRVLTEYLEPSQYGELVLGLTFAGLVTQVVTGGLIAGIGRFYSVAIEARELRNYLSATRQVMIWATACVVLIVFVLLFGLSGTGYDQWVGLVVVVLAYSILSGLNQAMSAIQNAARLRPVVALHAGADAWLKIVFAVGAMLFLGNVATAVVTGYVLSVALVSLSQYRFLLRLGQSSENVSDNPQMTDEWVSKICRYAWPFSVWGGFAWAQQASDRWALEAFASAHDVGQYAVLFQLGYAPIGVLTGLATSFFEPILYQRAGAASDRERNALVHRVIWRIAGIYLLLTFITFLLTMLLHEPIFRLLVAQPYRSLSVLLPWFVLAGGIFSAGQMLAVKLLSEIRVLEMALAKIASAVVGAFSNVVGAYYFGVAGVAAAILFFSVVYFIWMAALVRSKACHQF